MSKEQKQCLLTPPEVAEILHVSRSYAYQLLDKGKLPYIQIGRLRRVHPDDLQKFMKSYCSRQVAGN